MLYREHGTTSIYRYRFPRLRRLWGRWHLVLGYAAAPWIDNVPTVLFYHVWSVTGVRRVTFL